MFVFLVFIFFQIQYRWERDSKNIPKWILGVDSFQQNIGPKQSIMIPLNNYSLIEGDAFTEVNIFNSTLQAKDNVFIKMNVHISVDSAPLSYHSVHCLHKKYYTKLDMYGKGSIYFMEIMNMKSLSKLNVEYLYDYSDIDAPSTIFMSSIIRNGFI